jgi:radical SAM protein with 4Fe4S-binding SPASM domain
MKVMEELAACGCLFLAFTGGEPLLREDILELLAAAAERNFSVTLQSNATLIGKREARLIAGLPNTRVDVSLYGARPSTHDYLTGEKGSFRDTMKALVLMKELGVPIMLKTVVGGFNLDEVEDIAALAEELEAPVIFTSLIFPRNDCDAAPTLLRLGDVELERFMRFEIDHLPRYLSEVMGREITDVADYVRQCAIGPHDPESGSKRYCGAGRTIFAVNPYGEVYPCVAFPLVVGNLIEGSFSDIWRDSRGLLEIRRKELEVPQQCGDCSHLDRCGICRALSFQEQGDVLAVSREKCRMTKTLMRVLENA